MKTTKTAATMTQTNAAPVTKQEVMDRFVENMTWEIDRRSGEIRKAIERRQAELAQIAQYLASPTDVIRAPFALENDWSGHQDLHETAGQFKIWLALKRQFEQLTATQAAINKTLGNEPTAGPEAVLQGLIEWVINAAIDDSSRAERSSNGFSNAIAICQGQGRGFAYREIRQMLHIYLTSVGKAV